MYCGISHSIASVAFTLASRQTLYLEVLGLAGQPDWETFTSDIAKEWMEMELNGTAPVPHWAKQWSYLDGIDRHIQEVTKSFDLLKKANIVLVITKAKET